MKDKMLLKYELSNKISNVLLFIFSIFLAFFITYSFYKFYYSLEAKYNIFYIYIIFISSLLIIITIFLIFKLNTIYKLNLTLFIYSTLISIYFVEAYFEYFHYDTRTKIEVINDLKKNNIDAFPNFNPMKHNLNNNKYIYNLGGISYKTIVFCNELGFWSIYDSDKYGFNNEETNYDNQNIDIILLGDSFVEGACVKPSQTISASLRKHKFNSISLGKSGNGPLRSFATLKEYGIPLKPKIVLWFFNIYDLNGLNSESKSKILLNYYKKNNFSQNLINRQEEINKILIKYLDTEWSKLKDLSDDGKIINFLKLSEIRKILNIKPKSNIRIDENVKIDFFIEILNKSKNIVSNWDGKIYFVYLPEYEKYFNKKTDINYKIILDRVESLGIPIINIQDDVFDKHTDPMSLFPFRKLGHYTQEGYQLVAEEIRKQLFKKNN